MPPGRLVGCLLWLFVLGFELLPAAAFPARTQDGNATFVLCTAQGAVLSRRLSGDDGPATTDDGTPFCVFCLPLLQGALPPSGISAADLPPLRLVGIIRPVRPPPPPQAKLHGSVDARAPPIA